MPKKNPRNNGFKGTDLVRHKYNYLIDQGIPAKYARKFRKNSWEKIDEFLKLAKTGMIEKVSLPPKLAQIKTKGRREKKPKNIPEGSHWRKGYSRNGKWISGSIVKNPIRQPPDHAIITSEYPKIIVVYKDQTDEVGAESIIKAIRKNNRKRNDYLTTEILGNGSTPGWYDQKFTSDGSIGIADVQIAYSREEEKAILRKYQGWTVIYADTPKYKPLLSLIATLGQYIYQPHDKKNTAGMIALVAGEINPTVGKKLEPFIL